MSLSNAFAKVGNSINYAFAPLFNRVAGESSRGRLSYGTGDIDSLPRALSYCKFTLRLRKFSHVFPLVALSNPERGLGVADETFSTGHLSVVDVPLTYR